ncbi:hypothetical protein AVEN_168918-1, partial [Araneus ventricosus]
MCRVRREGAAWPVPPRVQDHLSTALYGRKKETDDEKDENVILMEESEGEGFGYFQEETGRGLWRWRKSPLTRFTPCFGGLLSWTDLSSIKDVFASSATLFSVETQVFAQSSLVSFCLITGIVVGTTLSLECLVILSTENKYVVNTQVPTEPQ